MTRISKADVVETMIWFFNQTGFTPTTTDMQFFSEVFPHYVTIRKHFGSYDGLRLESGLPTKVECQADVTNFFYYGTFFVGGVIPEGFERKKDIPREWWAEFKLNEIYDNCVELFGSNENVVISQGQINMFPYVTIKIKWRKIIHVIAFDTPSIEGHKDRVEATITKLEESGEILNINMVNRKHVHKRVTDAVNAVITGENNG